MVGESCSKHSLLGDSKRLTALPLVFQPGPQSPRWWPTFQWSCSLSAYAEKGFDFHINRPNWACSVVSLSIIIYLTNQNHSEKWHFQTCQEAANHGELRHSNADDFLFSFNDLKIISKKSTIKNMQCVFIQVTINMSAFERPLFLCSCLYVKCYLGQWDFFAAVPWVASRKKWQAAILPVQYFLLFLAYALGKQPH